jgi:glycosyltransferase involved in cell wall biosynthesis
MKIGIAYTSAVWQGAGIGRYTRELIRAVVSQSRSFEYVLFYAARGLNERQHFLSDLRRLQADFPHVRTAPIPLSPRRLTQFWQRLRVPLPVEVFTGRIDVLHAPDFVMPPTRAPALVTVHDLSFLVYPQFAARGMARYLSDAVPRSVRRASMVLADSEATRHDLGRFLHLPPERVTVVYPGVSPAFQPLPPEVYEPVRRNYGLTNDFLLFVSTLSPRKNIVRIVEAFAALIADGQRPTLDLVLVGQRGWMYEEIFAIIERLQLGERVRLLDFVNDSDLPALYNAAVACVYPSLYEGFGLPALEALACGTPLVTAHNSSLTEIAEGVAVLADAQDTASIANGISRVLDDADLRARFRAAGLERAKQFTWERAAEQVLACYQQLHAQPRPRAGRSF